MTQTSIPATPEWLEICNDWLDYDESMFVCTLPENHTGRHRDAMHDGDGPHPRGMAVEWDQTPQTVAGSIVR